MRLALVVEYEGTHYHGFQYQASAPSIQEELEKAISRFTGESLRVRGAGRTDAGVHALGQVVAFDTDATHPLGVFVRALNFYLPDEIAVKAAYRAADDFDPRRMAVSRTYRYTIYCGAVRSPLIRRTAYQMGEPIDVRTMRRAAAEFVGKHDFARFAAPLGRPGASTVRHIYEAKLRQDGESISLEVQGNAFLPHQVRRMAGALVDVGRGRLTAAELKSMIDCEPSGLVARSLPPHGLCLLRVTYADFPIEVGLSDVNVH